MGRRYRSPESPGSTMGNAGAISWLFILVAALVGCGPVGGTEPPAATPGQATPAQAGLGASQGTDCIIRDELGRQVWFGEADPSVTAVGNALQAIVEEHNDQTTGVALCSHYEGATIFVVSPGNDVQQSIAEVASKFPDLHVITRATTASISQLSAAGRKLLQSPGMQGLVTGAGPDMYSGGLRITVAQDKWPLSATEKGRIDDAVKVLNGSRLPLIYEQGGTAVLD